MSEFEQMFNDILDAPADSALAKEAKAQTTFSTLLTGMYTIQATGVEVEAGSEKSPWPDRPLFRVKSKATGANGKGFLSFDMSPVVYRTKTGRLDGPATLWGNVITAFNLESATNREVAEAVRQYPMDAYVEEVYNDGNGKWIKASNEQESKALAAKGYEARNFVRNLKAVQG